MLSLTLFRIIFPFFLLGIGSSWYYMVLTSCVLPSNFKDLPHLVFPLEQASLYLCGQYIAYLLEYIVSTLHSYVKFLEPCNKYVSSLVGQSIVWANFFGNCQRRPPWGWYMRRIFLPLISCYY